MNKSVHEVCESLMDEACMMFERDEGLVSTSFALGHSRAIYVQPATEEGCQIDPQTRVRIMALIASSTGAIYLGRIDEALLAERPADARPLSRDELRKLARKDPTIKTALVVQATDTRSGDTLVLVATPHIRDDGTLLWEHGVFTDSDGELISEAQQAVALASILTVPYTDQELRDELQQLGWAMADTDEVGPEHPEENY